MLRSIGFLSSEGHKLYVHLKSDCICTARRYLESRWNSFLLDKRHETVPVWTIPSIIRADLLCSIGFWASEGHKLYMILKSDCICTLIRCLEYQEIHWCHFWRWSSLPIIFRTDPLRSIGFCICICTNGLRGLLRPAVNVSQYRNILFISWSITQVRFDEGTNNPVGDRRDLKRDMWAITRLYLT